MRIIFASLILVILVSFCMSIMPVCAAKDDGAQTTADALESVEKFSETVGILKADSDPRALIGQVISIVIGVVGSVALVIVVYGGIMWMTAGGNEGRVAKAQKSIMWGIFGLLIVLFSYVIVRAILTKVIGITNL